MQSGEFTGTQNKMSKRGSRLLRRVLSQLLLLISAPSGQNSLQPCTDGILQKQMPEQAQESSFGAVMRKLVNYIFAVLRDRKPYELRSPKSTRKCLQRSTQQLSSTCTRCLVFKNQFTISGQLFYVY